MIPVDWPFQQILFFAKRVDSKLAYIKIFLLFQNIFECHLPGLRMPGCERNVSPKIIARILGNFRTIFPECFLFCVLGEILIQCDSHPCLLVHPVPSNFHRNSLILKISA